MSSRRGGGRRTRFRKPEQFREDFRESGSDRFKGGRPRYQKNVNLIESINNLSSKGDRDSKVALEIIKSVIEGSGDGGYESRGYQDDGYDEQPPSKMRRTEGGFGASKFPKRNFSGRGRRNEYRSRSYRKDGKDEERKPLVPGKTIDGVIAVPKNPAFEIPAKALYCRMCENYMFQDKQEYLVHKATRFHKNVAHTFNSRNLTILKQLRRHAKAVTLKKYPSSNTEACRVCCGTYGAHIGDHVNTLEHLLVHNFLNKQCCGKSFKERVEYEDHTLSPFHLVNKYEEECRWAEEEKDADKDDASDETEDTNDELLKEFVSMKKNEEENAGENDDKEFLESTHDPEQVIGLKHIDGKKVFRCRACIVELPANDLNITAHLHSPDHYMEVLRVLKKEENENRSADDPTLLDPNLTSSIISKSTTKKEIIKKDVEQEEEEEEEAGAEEEEAGAPQEGEECEEDQENDFDEGDQKEEEGDENEDFEANVHDQEEEEEEDEEQDQDQEMEDYVEDTAELEDADDE